MGPIPSPVGLDLRLAGERRGAGRTHGMLRSTSALLRPGTHSRPQVALLLVPSFTPQCGETCRTTLPIGPVRAPGL